MDIAYQHSAYLALCTYYFMNEEELRYDAVILLNLNRSYHFANAL